MARRSIKSRKGSNGADQGDIRLPSFDEKALVALTEKIEKGFGKSPASQHQPYSVDRSQQNAKKEQKGSNSSTITSKTKTQARGLKRDAHGKAKVAEHANPKSRNQPRDHNNGTDTGDRAALLEEILALGGNEDDLDLVADAVSEGEDEDLKIAAPLDKSLRKDIAKFVADLGIGEKLDGMSSASEPDEGAEEERQDTSDLDPEDASDGKTETEPGHRISRQALPDAPLSKDPSRLIFEARPDWHAASLPDLPKPMLDDSSRYREAISSLKDYAIFLLETDNKIYASKHLSSSSSHRFLSTIMSSGTLSDKVSALTLVVQESPIHTTKSFESLLSLAKKRSRGQAVTALGAMKDLLGEGVVLPADRRLRSFAAQPGLLGTLQEKSTLSWKLGQPLPGQISKAHLITWAYEDWLKEAYFDMLKVLEGWCNDEVEFARSRAVTYVYELLKEKPEQESNLLRLLVNKLGDPEKKIASRTSYLVLQLQISHPLMKPIIIRSIESELLLRPGLSSHAKYYAINTLNQTILSGKEENVARHLLDIYFDLFVSLLKNNDFQKVLTGPVVNRKGQVQGGGGPMGKKARAKITREEEASKTSQETTEKMISAVLTGVNRALPFSKTDDLTLENHMDTLFKITHSSNFNTSIQALMLIEQLATSKHIGIDRFYRTLYESLLDPRLVSSSKHTLYLNLLYRALRSDLDIKRVKAFAKRMVQVVTLHQPPFICGVLYLLREMETTFPGLRSLLNDPEDDDQAGEENFRDVPDDGENLEIHGEPDQQVQSDHRPRLNNAFKSYDGRKRDPEYSQADKSCLWESIPFLSHFHPSVSMFASSLVNDKKVPPRPDLATHSLTHFLDRFVYRNAKAAAGGARGSSIMQPMSGGDNRGILLSSRATNIGQQESVNSEAFWRKKTEEVAVDEVFFHKYFSQIGKAKQASSKVVHSKTTPRSGEDDESENENENKIWQALVDSRPEVEGNSDDDSDMEMLDLDDSDLESSHDVDIAEGDANDAWTESEESEAHGFSGLDEEDILSGSRSDAPSEIDELFAKEFQEGEHLDSTARDVKSSRHKKRRLKSLPTFASVDDYAEMLENDEGEDL